MLDFFAGSGTVGHACLGLARDAGHRNRFILIQLPEPVKGDKRFKTIFEITRQRVEKASSDLRDPARPEDQDLGFRVYRLAKSNVRVWDPDPSDLEGTLLAHAEHLVPGRTEEDILTELLLKLGLDLCVPIKKREIADRKVYAIGSGALIVCLSDGLTREVVEILASSIVAWHKDLAPAIDSRVVFKDSGFADDVAKTNMAAILQQSGISDIRSI